MKGRVIMNLVIAEKPSVAQSIAKVLGATIKHDGYLEGPAGPGDLRLGPPGAERRPGYLVSWCVGHLVELAEPEEYDGKYEKWRKEDLPILPTDWLYQVSPGTKKQFQILKDLMKREDAYTEYRRIKEENKELQMAKHNLEWFLNQQEEEQKQKEKQQSKSGQSL